MANILYRGSLAPTATNTSGAKNAPLTNDEIDKNLYALDLAKFEKSGGIVTGDTTFNTNVTVQGNLTVSGTTTAISTVNLQVTDANIELGKVTTPTDATANGGGITLLGATNKTFNWVSTSAAWTSSEHIALAAGKTFVFNGSTSGTVTLSIPAVAATTAISFPATSGTVVTTGDTGTVTNTMLAGSISTGKISGLAASATIDTTNATNITSGTLPNARLSAVPNSALANSTISGVALGSNLFTLSVGSYLTGSAYNGSAVSTLAVDATAAATASKVVARDASGNFSANIITATLSGNASTAAAWQTARSFSITGDASWSVTADGSANVTGALTLANSGVTAGVYGSSTSVPVITVDAKGRVTSVSTSSISGSLTFTGDVTGSGSTGSSTALTLANSGVTAGTYTKVTVDAKGRVTVGASLASADLPTYTGTLTSSQITTGLGFTPYNSTNPSGYITSSANISGTSAGINVSAPVLATATESNSLYVTAPSYTTDTPVKLLNFDWYSNVFSLGNIRSGSTASSGFGVFYTASGGSLTEIARFGTDSSLNVVGALKQNGNQVLHAGNYNSYAPTLTGGGASGTWGISISGNAATASTISATVTGTSETNLLYANMADNDQFRLRVGGSASDSGWVELATADNGTEPIYVRQYSGVFTTLVRTATLLDGSGNTTFPGNVTAYSDIRIKKNIQPIANALDKVSAINGVTYNRKDDDDNRRYAGVIAQEVEAVMPEFITQNEDGMLSVAYGNMVGLLVEAIKELNAKVVDLQNQLANK